MGVVAVVGPFGSSFPKQGHEANLAVAVFGTVYVELFELVVVKEGRDFKEHGCV